ncbi:MAG: tetratricopeptide repeat protein [Bacteroidales bacterium]|nr:tetratricopeptide repeat protein [Bacteroidales bacterium]
MALITVNVRNIYVLLFWVLFLVPILTKGEESTPDNLKNLLNTTSNDTTRIGLLHDLSLYYLKSNPDTAFQIANEAIYIARKINYRKGVGSMYILLGHVRVIENNLFDALDYYMKALEEYKHCGCIVDIVTVRLLLGNVYLTVSNYPEAMDNYQKGVVLADSLNLIEVLPHFYNNLGELNDKLQNYEEAINNFNKGLQIREDEGDKVGAAYILVNLSRINITIGKFGPAIEYLDRAHNIYYELGHNEGLFNVYNVHASLERARDDYAKAIEYYLHANTFLDKIGNEYLGPSSPMEADLNINLGFCYLKEKKFDNAKYYLSRGYKIAEETGQLEFLKIASEYLSRLSEQTGNIKESLRYAKYFKVYSDSLSKDENIKKITQLEMQFAFDQKLREREIEQAKLDARQKRKELVYIMISGSIFLALIILFLLFRLQRVKVKRINLEKINLQSDLDYKNKELTTNVMYLLKKNEFIINISDKLKKSRYDFKPENRKVVDEIIRELEKSSTEDTWKDFEMRFQEVHADFYQQLISQFPDLSPNELKLCAFLRLNMSTKEISTITFQSPKSISMARFRLRKKMGIGSYDNLVTFLNQL